MAKEYLDPTGLASVWERIKDMFVEKVAGKGLSTNDYTDAEKTKLSGIAENANKYTHPTYTSRSNGLYKVTVNGTGHVSGVSSVTKSDITGLGIPENDTTYTDFMGATSSNAGDSGLVPAPAKGAGSKVLAGSGTWKALGLTTYPDDASYGIGMTLDGQDIGNTIYLPDASATQRGLMSASDKEKLDNLSDSGEVTNISGNAATATKLSTSRAIDGVKFDGSAAISHYATCSTSGSTAAKTCSITNFTLVTGARVFVRFSYANTASSPTLNVSSTGAKPIYYKGAAVPSGYIRQYTVLELVYGGSSYPYWYIVGDLTQYQVDALSTKVANLYALLWSGNYTLSSSNSLTITGVSSSNMANPVIMIKAYLPGSNSAYSPSAGTGTDYVIYIPIKLHEQSNVNSSGYSYYYSSITYGSSYMALQYKQQTNSLILTTTGSTIYITEVAALFIG